MGEESGEETLPGRRHIIKRPRLTRLLDETEARVIMLVAPAGYGKTTLAREWLTGREHCWYQASSASADVAALAVGVATAAEDVLSGIGKRTRERLSVAGQTGIEPGVLAELLAEDLGDWPLQAWLAIDDYHFAAQSFAAEEFIRALVESSPVNWILTSRTRPAWATARRLLYGEIAEVGRSALAMTQEEASKVLARRSRSALPGLVALAEGWPAVIGLAATTADTVIPDDDLPDALYDFFAEELYQSLPGALQWELCRLSLAPTIPTAAESLFGVAARELALQGVRLGFLSQESSGDLQLHPLFRSFLHRKFDEHEKTRTDPAVREVARYLLERHYWDDVFWLAERFHVDDLFVELLDRSTEPLLREGRLASLETWLTHARARGCEGAALDLTEAEVRFRQGDHAVAEAYALHAAKEASRLDMRTRALVRAAQAAFFANDVDLALTVCRQARDANPPPSLVGQILWTQFLASLDIEDQDAASSFIEEFERATSETVENIVRLGTGRLMLALRFGGVDEAIAVQAPLTSLATRLPDPMIRSSFYTSLSRVLRMGAQYAQALDVLERAFSVATEFRLEFVLPHVQADKVATLVGLGRLAEAQKSVGELDESRVSDPHVVANLHVVASKLALAQGNPQSALMVLDRAGDAPDRGTRGEVLAYGALAKACLGRTRDAKTLADLARDTTRTIETAQVCLCVDAIIESRSSTARQNAADRAVEFAGRSGSRDPLVVACRASLDFASTLRELPRALHGAMDAVVSQITLTADQTVPDDRLTRREAEVYLLVGEGLTNREIAKRLFISEVTVKVHLRHIFAKLGLRSRVQVAVQAAERRSHAASADRSHE